jgi:Mn-dependent DtxR family transcriptional regulator
MDDHLERIYLLIDKKGYARVSDIASELTLSPSSVTRMVQKLGDQGFVNYEKYRGITLTSKGKAVAEAITEKHKILEKFLGIIGVSETNVQREVEGIEHHISLNTAMCMYNWSRFIEENPAIMESFSRFRGKNYLDLSPAKNNL